MGYPAANTASQIEGNFRRQSVPATTVAESHAFPCELKRAGQNGKSPASQTEAGAPGRLGRDWRALESIRPALPRTRSQPILSESRG